MLHTLPQQRAISPAVLSRVCIACRKAALGAGVSCLVRLFNISCICLNLMKLAVSDPKGSKSSVLEGERQKFIVDQDIRTFVQKTATIL
jgi:hypothetical protein